MVPSPVEFEYPTKRSLRLAPRVKLSLWQQEIAEEENFDHDVFSDLAKVGEGKDV